MDGNIFDTLLVPAVVFLAGWILYLMFRRYQVAMQMRQQRMESFNKLIEKFGSAKEFAEFVQTDVGKKFLADPAMPAPNPLNKVLRFLQAGILFVIIGIGYMMNGTRLEHQTDPNYVHQMMDANYWGTLSVFIGVGLIVVAGISYVLTRHWHLANGSAHK